MTLERRLEDILRASPSMMTVMTGARELDLPDWLIVSGAVYQRVWNHVTGREPDYGVRDYDLVYFDPDTSWDAEDLFIKRAAALFPPPLTELVEVRNQARVHLWFHDRFGEDYEPLPDTDAALERFVAPAFGIGVRLEDDDTISVAAAPFGLQDVFDMVIRPNPNRPLARGWDKVVASARSRWPELQVVGDSTG